MKIGIMDDALAQPWENLFKVAAQIGFKGVELGVHKDYSETKLWRKEGRKELVDLSVASNVSITSICLHVFRYVNFASPESLIRKKAADIAKEAAAIASEVGARNLLIPLFAQNVPAEEARKRWIQGIRYCADIAENYGVVYALENVDQPFAKTAEQLVSIVDEINSPAVKVYYDPGNVVFRNLDPLKDINVLGNRISQVHMKDPYGKYLGIGKMDIPSVIRALKEIKYDGWLILEKLETPATPDPFEAGKKNLEFLLRLL
jgi:sugar phosphate isomerase/epimerase